ncbi:MAG: dynamin family protein [Bacillota bacterium]
MENRFNEDLEKARNYLQNWFADHQQNYQDNNRIIAQIEEAKKKLSEERRLKIAIAGRMNTGKSMLVDNLFFEGRGIVNSSETPSTARLTILNYSEQQYAEVVFLSRDDEHELRKLADIYKNDEERIYKYAYDLIEDIDKQGTADHILGTKKRISSEELKEYSDAGGKYTPFVKSINLYCNEDILKNVEIIDTPGLGDPVISREKITNDKIREVDVVIYLSAASQFMDEEDIKYYLFLKDLGVDYIIVLASRFDEILPEHSMEGVDVEQSKEFLELKSGFVNRLEHKLKEMNDGKELNISSYMPSVYPASPLIAKIKYTMDHQYSLPEDEEDNMFFYRNRYEDELGIDFSKDDPYQISGILVIKQRLVDLEKKKEAILFHSKKAAVLQCLSSIRDLYNKDIVELKFRQSTLELALEHPEDMDQIKSDVQLYGEKYKMAFKKVGIDAKERCIEKKCKGLRDIIDGYMMAAKNMIDQSTMPRDIRNAFEILGTNLFQLFTISKDDHFEISNGNLYNQMSGYLTEYLDEVKFKSLSTRTNEIVTNTLQSLRDNIRIEFRKQLSIGIGDSIQRALSGQEINNLKDEYYEQIKDLSYSINTKNPWRKKKKNKKEENNSEVKSDCKAVIDNFAEDIYSRIDRLSSSISMKLFDDIIKLMESILEEKLRKLFDVLSMDIQKNIGEELEKVEEKIPAIQNVLNMMRNDMDAIESVVLTFE